MISFTFDDGYTSTLRQAAPILREFGMVGTVGAICNRVFWDSPPRFMDVDELRQLVEAGWEVASHSLFHRRLPLLPPSYTDEAAEWHYDPLADAFVADCPWGDVGTVVCEGQYLKRARSLDHLRKLPAGFSHQPGKVYLRPGSPGQGDVRAEFGSAEREIIESRRILEEQGFRITSFIVPYSSWSSHLHHLGADHYKYVASVSQDSTEASFLPRVAVNKDRSADQIISYIEKRSRRKSAIICLHDLVTEIKGPWDWPISEFRRLIEWVASSRIPVETLSAGADRLTREAKAHSAVAGAA